jgi:hypothetical protein
LLVVGRREAQWRKNFLFLSRKSAAQTAAPLLPRPTLTFQTFQTLDT